MIAKNAKMPEVKNLNTNETLHRAMARPE